jgi:hypothetical protein
MKHQTIRRALIVFALVALSAAGLRFAPAAEAAREPDTSKIEPALLQAMQGNPQGEFAVIVESGLPDLRDISDLKGLNTQRSNGLMNRLRANEGKQVNSLAIIGAAAATLDYQAIIKLSGDPFISYIRQDRKLVPLSGSWGGIGELD